MRTPLPLVAVLATLLAACGAPAPSLTLPTQAPKRDQVALDAAAEAFYTADSVAALKAAVAAAAQAGPETALYHELAAELAALEARPSLQLQHLLAALLDPSAQSAVLYLHWLAELSWSVGEREQVEAVLSALERGHPDPEVRAFAAWMMAHARHLKDDAQGRDESLKRVGFLPKLALVGTWDNDQGKGFDAEYPPERDVDLKARFPGKLVEIGWRTDYPRDPRGKTDLEAVLHPTDWQVAYAATGIQSAKGGAYELRLSASDPLKVWLNEDLVFSGSRLDGWCFDGLVIPVTLRPGNNRLLIKSAQQTGGWLLAARVTRPGGENVAPGELTATPADLPYAEGVNHAEPFGERAMVDRRVASLPDGARKTALEVRWAGDMGLRAEQAALAEAFHQRFPKSVIARDLLATALWENEEQGRTADLLNALQSEFGQALVRFSLEQARFWRTLRLDVKARRLLMALRDQTPDRPGVWLALADSFESEGWIEERCEALAEANRRWPDWPEAQFKLADCYQDQRFFPKAQKLLKAILAHQPGNEEALGAVLFDVLSNERYAEAAEIGRTLTRLWPHRIQHWERLSETARRQGDRAGAEAAAAKVVALKPTAPTGYDLLGILARQAGDVAAAVSAWRAALARDPEDDDLANRLAFLAPESEGAWMGDVPDEQEIEEAIAARAAIKPGAGTNVVYLMDDEVTLLGADGSTANVVTLVAHALDQKGRDDLTLMELRGARARLMLAYAVDPEGNRLEASSIRGRSVRFRQLTPGSTVVLQYRIDERPDGYLAGHMSRVWWFQGPGLHTLRGRWVLWAPAGTALLEHRQGDLKREERREGDLIRVAWLAEDSAPMLFEPGMPTPQEVATHVEVSTVPDWDTFSKWEQALLQDAFREGPSVKALADQLLADAKTPEEKIQRITAFLVKEIRYQQDYERPIAGVQPHAAPVVLSRRYGDCKDKAVLFITLARLAGIEAHFALVRTRDVGPVRQSVPMQQFNHAIVFIPAQPGVTERFVDPTVDALDLGVLRHDDQGTWSLVLDPKTKVQTWRLIPYQAPEEDTTRADSELTLAANGDAQGTIRLTARGRLGELIRKSARNATHMLRFLEQQVGGTYPNGRLTGQELIEVESLTAPAEVRFTLEAPGLGRVEGRELRLPIPIGWSPQTYFGLGVRQTELLLGTPRVLAWSVKLKLPAGAKVKRLPATATVDTPCIGLTRTVKAEGDQVTATQQVTMRCERIAVEAYGAHREKVGEMIKLLNEDLVVSLPR